MKVASFYDKDLAQASYCIVSDHQIAVIDPARDPKPYYEYAEENKGKIIAVIETHPHADFVSSHLEIHKETGADIYVSKLVNAAYPHKTFDQDDILKLGRVKLEAYNTPGHSPDSISVLLIDENDKACAVFTGDTLFIGDAGRPDLREKVGNQTGKREALARMMYHSIHDTLMKFEEDAVVYPGHGEGSLCGKSMSSERSSTIGKQRDENWALQKMPESEFVEKLLADQPFIPKYFSHCVNVNNKGAADFETSIAVVPRLPPHSPIKPDVLIIDTRPETLFKKGHVKKSVNLMDGERFETWLGAIVSPEERFYLIADRAASLETVIRKAAKIGYEINIEGALLSPDYAKEQVPVFDLAAFKANPGLYTVVDIRNDSELKNGMLFQDAIHIPLHELRERAGEVSTEKPVVVHCAGGYRSAAGTSILYSALIDASVYDMGESVKDFTNQPPT